MRQARAGNVVCLAGGAYSGRTLEQLPPAAGHPSQRPGRPRADRSRHDLLGGDLGSGPVDTRRGGPCGRRLVREAAPCDITGGGEGVVFDTSDCTVANAPTWAGCEPQAPVSNVVISGNHFHGIGQSGSEDAIHLDNWRNVTVSGNELDRIIESGNHTDCLQSVYGGRI